MRIIILAGQYYDAETGLHYNWHRYYDPKTGRYLTPDPIGLLGGINLFTYTENNPVNAIDPLGLRIQLMGTPKQQQYTLSQLKLFTRGGLSIDERGTLTRTPCEEDEGIESLVDELINSDNLYRIFDHLYPNGTGRAQAVPTVHGGDIYFDPNVEANYFVGPFSQDPITPAAELAHELLGRGIQFERGEPHGRYGSREREKSNRRAMKRANPAFIRMGMKPRFRYK